MFDFLKEKLSGKKIVLLGFGREGQSTYAMIRKALPYLSLVVADIDENVRNHVSLIDDNNISFRLGDGYLEGLDRFDLIIKTPGISLRDIKYPIKSERITSQTDMFLQVFSGRIIGITGTKGKSTTSTLIWHILKKAGKDAILLGNIGKPAFNCIEDIHPETIVVYEMSSHQLEYICVSPHIAILLNLYEEHLDAYRSFRDYQLAKFNITKYQHKDDYFIYNADDPLISYLISEFHPARNYQPFSFENPLADGCYVMDNRIFYSDDCISRPVYNLNDKRKLKGDHNIRNIMAAINACKILGIDNEFIEEGIAGFNGLEHRMEYVGLFRGIHFYNDSIATIPEAAIEAVKALEKVDTIILGGFDRGIEYSGLAVFLSGSSVRNFICTGEAGKRIYDLLSPIIQKEQNLLMINGFDEFPELAFKYTVPGGICLLSPAAASYDEFQNFEIRGKRFRELLWRHFKNADAKE